MWTVLSYKVQTEKHKHTYTDVHISSPLSLIPFLPPYIFHEETTTQVWNNGIFLAMLEKEFFQSYQQMMY